MSMPTIPVNSLWAGLFSVGCSILLTAPPRYIVATFFCGFAGRFVSDLCKVWGLNLNWSTAVGAAAVVLIAVAVVRRHKVSPVVLVCGVLPLGPAVAMFNMILELLKLSAATGEARGVALIAFGSNLAKVLTVTLAIALGIAAGLAIERLFTQEVASEI